jgi:uncharacterized membrane protein
MKALRPLLAGLLLFLAAAAPAPALAQESSGLTLITDFPSQVVGLGESLTLRVSLRTQSEPQVVDLQVLDLPEGWEASFRSGGRVVLAAYVEPAEETSLDLRIDIPADGTAGKHTLRIRAHGETQSAEMPITLMVEERAPASLDMSVELPVLRGRPDSTFRYNVTLDNEGDDDLVVDLSAQAPSFYSVLFKSAGQEVTSIPLEANATERLSVEVDPLFTGIPAGTYGITLLASGGEAQASLDLAAEVVGQSTLALTTPDGRLSGRLEAGEETPVTLVVQNSGSAPALGIKLSATPPREWTVTFEPETIESVEANSEVTVTARITPSEKALAGDYMLTVRAQPETGSSTSLEYRATVRTSTLWGVAGLALIAVAVGVVGLAVMRFGRR